MTALTVFPDRLSALTVADLAVTPALQLAEIVRNLDELSAWHKQQRAKLDAALDLRFGEQARAALHELGRDFGTVHLDHDALHIKFELPKKVTWDQKQLHHIAERLVRSGQRVDEFLEVKFSVPETRFGNWPRSLREAYAEARTVEPGKPNFTLTLREVA